MNVCDSVLDLAKELNEVEPTMKNCLTLLNSTVSQQY